MVPLSVLDLSPIARGSSAGEALWRSLDLAQHAERLGFHRYWVAEHHNMPGIASAATAVVIGHLAAGTSRIRVGAGGIMLPNHAPLVIAEQFGTLEALFPGRIDLGLGRAPGTDGATLRALRRSRPNAADAFPHDVGELMAYFDPAVPGQAVQAVPGAGHRPELWILGSSLFGAEFAAVNGLPFAFASHFAPDALDDALALYREKFAPSPALARPHAAAALGVYAAATDAEAARLFTSQQQAFVQLRRGTPGLLPPPVEDLAAVCTAPERAMIDHVLRESVVGAPATVRRGLAAFLARTRVDELIVTNAIFDHAARVRSLALTAESAAPLTAPPRRQALRQNRQDQ